MSRHLVRLTVLAVVIVGVAGCTRSPGTTAAPTGTESAETATPAEIVPSANDCVSLYLSIDALDPTLENLRAESKDVVVGTVVSEGAPFWDSPTGRAPKPGEPLGEGNEFYILTPYTVTIDEAVAGSRAAGDVTVVVEGGEIDCNKLEVSPAVTLAVKDTYVLFLKPRQAADGAGALNQPMVFHAFPVQSDGKVLTPLDGAVSLADLSSALSPAP
jgi:hypothetical protein